MNPKILNLVKKYNLDLSGLVVLTEAASGAYLLNPFIALAAGAKKVICKAKTTRYGLAKDITQETLALSEKWGFLNQILIKENLDPIDFKQVDIITNSGHLRPIRKEHITHLKPTAVLPLMWETWEFRDQDIDLNACKENEILVLGTNESTPPCDMKKYSAMIGVKLLIELGLEIAGNKIILMGSTSTLCGSIKEALQFLGADVVWFSHDNPESDFNYFKLRDYLIENAMHIDALLFFEHHFPDPIIGKKAFIRFSEIERLNPHMKIGISCGNIDIEDLENSTLSYFPKDIQLFSYMTYQSFHVGALPVMDLFAAGLKVGEVMARARLSGMSIRDATFYALKNSPAMDF